MRRDKLKMSLGITVLILSLGTVISAMAYDYRAYDNFSFSFEYPSNWVLTEDGNFTQGGIILEDQPNSTGLIIIWEKEAACSPKDDMEEFAAGLDEDNYTIIGEGQKTIDGNIGYGIQLRPPDTSDLKVDLILIIFPSSKSSRNLVLLYGRENSTFDEYAENTLNRILNTWHDTGSPDETNGIFGWESSQPSGGILGWESSPPSSEVAEGGRSEQLIPTITSPTTKILRSGPYQISYDLGDEWIYSEDGTSDPSVLTTDGGIGYVQYLVYSERHRYFLGVKENLWTDIRVLEYDQPMQAGKEYLQLLPAYTEDNTARVYDDLFTLNSFYTEIDGHQGFVSRGQDEISQMTSGMPSIGVPGTPAKWRLIAIYPLDELGSTAKTFCLIEANLESEETLNKLLDTIHVEKID